MGGIVTVEKIGTEFPTTSPEGVDFSIGLFPAADQLDVGFLPMS